MNKTVGPKEELGMGIVGLGILTILMPYFSQVISDLDYVESSAFAILSGASMVLAALMIVAGLVVVFFNPE
jgi:hypothetical protein